MRNLLRGSIRITVVLATLSLFASALFAQSAQVPSMNELEHEISDRLKRVEEFKFIEQEAANLGVRAWLFGGTAAGYAHYVKWDLQREMGDPRFQSDRFDYDYTNIYRSTQDLDIVIDGEAKQAQALQNALMKKYPHLQGSKTAWEVRLLAQDIGDKQAILNNPDFMNQHTDSNSTGLIEITKPKAGESVIRDVRDWNSKQSHFLKDIQEGALHYYFSPNHNSTKYAREGRNPPILSAIRYLTKAFQYELTLRPEDLAKIKSVFDDFDPRRDTQNPYVVNWIEKNGKKLIQNAVNIEYATTVLEQLGIRKKLAAIRGDVSTVDSLAWWMNKEPLRSHVVGHGAGKTAKELGLDIVAHETKHFLAYESITRAHTGDANVFISRDDVQGESAGNGDGFYTKVGREGGRGTGLTIRFHLDPNAREGTDFIRAPQYPNVVVIKNKAALKVIPESLNIGPVEFFQMLAQGETLDEADRGILEKLRRRIGSRSAALSETEVAKIFDIVKKDAKSIEKSFTPVLNEWFNLPISSRHPELVTELMNQGTVDAEIVRKVLSGSHWKGHSEFVDDLLKKGNVDVEIMQSVLSQPHSKDHPEWVESLMKKTGTNFIDRYFAMYVLSQPHWQDHSEWIEALMKTGQADKEIVEHVLRLPHGHAHPELVMKLIKNGNADGEIAEQILSQPYSKDHPEWLEELIMQGKSDWEIERYVLNQPHWKDHPGLRRLTRGDEPTINNLVAAFESGETFHAAAVPSNGCLVQHLGQLLN